MKNKKLQLAPALSILALILAVSGNPALPDNGWKNMMINYDKYFDSRSSNNALMRESYIKSAMDSLIWKAFLHFSRRDSRLSGFSEAAS